MKSYPSIPYWNKGIFGDPVWGFDKLDGTNLRVEWSKKRSFYKFGTKSQLIDENHEQFGEAVKIFLHKYGETLPAVFAKHYRGVDSFVLFCEYLGENSFAGNHEPLDVKDVVLFDVNQYKRGFITPREFMDNFQTLGIPEVVYQGNYNRELIERVRSGDFNVKEGIVCKGVRRAKSKQDQIWMAKIKTNAWLEKLKNLKGIQELKRELNNDPDLITL